MNALFDPHSEVNRIVQFLKDVYTHTGTRSAVIAWSGGIDSTVSLYILANALPKEHITILHLPYETTYETDFRLIQSDLKLSSAQFLTISIRTMVDTVWHTVQDEQRPEIRKGNIMARIRMIVLYDCARKMNALVCGTENKTEDLLGYFTRFGDQASDIEPIQHLYKTQVYELAKELRIPKTFIERSPTAGLWSGQTDEGDFGFTYAEADEVLFRHFDKNMNVAKIEKEGFPNARKIITLAEKNSFKHKVPYKIQI